MSHHSLYQWWDIGMVKLLWNACANPNTHNLVVVRRDLEPALIPLIPQKSTCSDGFRQWIPISTIFYHSLWPWWDIGRVKLQWNACTNPNLHNLVVAVGDMDTALSPPLWLKKSAWCSDGFRQWISISTKSPHSLYSQEDIGSVKLLWNACSNPITHNLVVACSILANIVSTCDSKISLQWWFQTVNSNLNLVSPFIISMMRHWEGQAAVKCLCQSKHTQSCCGEKGSWAGIVPTRDSKDKLTVMVLDNEFQYQPCLTIHYTNDEILGWSSCCEMLVPIQTHTILLWWEGILSRHCPHSWLKR